MSLQRGFALRYERRKEIHADETMHTRTAKPFVPTPALVDNHIGCIYMYMYIVQIKTAS